MDACDIQSSDPAVAIAALQHEVAQLRAAVQARNDFISVAVHELRNPMTPLLIIVQSMRGMAERHPETPDPIAAGLARLDRVVMRYTKRCSTLLDISRLSTDSYHVEFSEIDLAAVLRATIEEMEPYAERAGSTIDVAAPATLTGEWDELALQQVIENLLSNAIKYGAGKSISVHLSVEHGMTLLEVSDGGIGITPADQARIFVPFERAVTRRQQPGFGLGLWVVARIIAALNGTIEVTSSPGKGSTFSVRLPQFRTTRVP